MNIPCNLERLIKSEVAVNVKVAKQQVKKISNGMYAFLASFFYVISVLKILKINKKKKHQKNMKK